MDVPAFASLAQVRILLLPIGNIPRETFNKWAAQIRTFEDVRLGDIPSDGRDERGQLFCNDVLRV
jgi:trafficking protein particle complex subunit 9